VEGRYGIIPLREMKLGYICLAFYEMLFPYIQLQLLTLITSYAQCICLKCSVLKTDKLLVYYIGGSVDRKVADSIPDEVSFEFS
jgi:hypothetical protein